jgi:hypothetical protein
MVRNLFLRTLPLPSSRRCLKRDDLRHSFAERPLGARMTALPPAKFAGGGSTGSPAVLLPVFDEHAEQIRTADAGLIAYDIETYEAEVVASERLRRLSRRKLSGGRLTEPRADLRDAVQ